MNDELWNQVINFFRSNEVINRMINATNADQPSLAGVVKDFERITEVNEFFRTHQAHQTVSFRQKVGRLIKKIMEENFFRTSGRKGNLGKRENKQANNIEGSLSRWFRSSEIYTRR